MLENRIFSPVRGVIWLFINEKAKPTPKCIPDSINLNDYLETKLFGRSKQLKIVRRQKVHSSTGSPTSAPNMELREANVF